MAGTIVNPELFPIVVDLAVRGFLLTGLAALVVLGLRHRSAALRHLVWAIAVTGLLAVPALRPILPDLAVPVAWSPAEFAGIGEGTPTGRSIRWSTRAGDSAGSRTAIGAGEEPQAASAIPPDAPSGHRAATGGGSPDLSARPTAATNQAGSEPAAVWEVATTWDRESSHASAGWLGAAALLWLVGAFLALLSFARDRIALARLSRASKPHVDPRMRATARRLARRLGLRRHVRLVQAPAGTIPMTWGIVRAVVALPPDAVDWPDERLEAVLLHELAHVARLDCAVQTVAEVARAIHWFNPLAWLAARRLRIERELACDDVALAAGARPSTYARQLVDLARAYHLPGQAGAASVPMAREADVGSRVSAVLDERRTRSGTACSKPAHAALLTGIVILPLAVVSPAAGTPDLEAGTAWTMQLAAGSGASDGLAPTISCAADAGEWSSVEQESNGRRREIRMSRADCRITVLIEEQGDDVNRRLEIVPGEGGVP